MAGPPFWFDAWWLYRESPVLPTRFRLIDWLRAVASLDFYSFHCFYLPPFLCFSFTICCSRRRSSFLVIASSRLCMVWDLWEGKDEQVCVKGSSQGCQWNSKTWDDDWFCYSIVSSEGKPNEIWKVTGEFRLERRGMTQYLMVAIQKVGKWVLRYMHIPAGLFILVVTSAIFSLRRSLRRQKPHPFVIPLCSNNISFIPQNAILQFLCTMNHPLWWNVPFRYLLPLYMFEIFLTLFPLALGNGRLACTNFEALATVGASENLVGAITRFTATRGALVSSVDKIIFVGSLGVV